MSRTHSTTTLQIQITKRSIQRAHHIPNRSRLSSVAHINNIVEPSLPRRRFIGPCHVAVFASVHLVFFETTAAEIEKLPVEVMVRIHVLLARRSSNASHLPRSPQAIHLPVMHPKRGIGRRSEQVAARVAADDIVDAAVGSDFDGVRDALGQETVLLDVGFGEKVWNLDRVRWRFPIIDKCDITHSTQCCNSHISH